MADLYARFSSWGSGHIDGRDAVNTARNIWAIGDEEGYWSERGRLAADVAWVAASHQEYVDSCAPGGLGGMVLMIPWDLSYLIISAAAVADWARLAMRWYGYELGKDSEQVREMAGLALDPLSHPVWGSRVSLAVGGP
jgi:hypothetical protein